MFRPDAAFFFPAVVFRPDAAFFFPVVVLRADAAFFFTALRFFATSCALEFSWTLDCERVLAGGVSR